MSRKSLRSLWPLWDWQSWCCSPISFFLNWRIGEVEAAPGMHAAPVGIVHPVLKLCRLTGSHPEDTSPLKLLLRIYEKDDLKSPFRVGFKPVVPESLWIERSPRSSLPFVDTWTPTLGDKLLECELAPPTNGAWGPGRIIAIVGLETTGGHRDETLFACEIK